MTKERAFSIMQYYIRPKSRALSVILIVAAVSGTTGLAATGCTSPVGANTPDTGSAAVSAASWSDEHNDVTRVAALLDVGVQQASAKHWQAASTTFQDVLAINPNNVYALYDLGVIDQTNGNPPGAISFYSRAIAANKKYTPAMYNKAILLESSDPQEAIGLYQEIIGINPQASTAYLRMAFTQAEQGNITEARAAYAKAIAIDPALGKYPLPAKR
jgi:tetratricopeptide (TPR) repeat protein